jgi:hypothetical protein
MPKPLVIETALERGLAFLEKNQEADGSYISFSSASMQPFRRLRSWQTTFVPALMLASLSGLDQPGALRMRGKLAGFLLEQKDANWAFNYWAKNAPEYRTMPYPNDLDDTFCALAGLYLHDPSIVDETVLAKAIKLLLATETAVGGPYRTWLVPSDSEPVWLDVDMAVNSNIAYCLSLVSNRLPSLDKLMGQAIASGSFTSPYYPSPYAFAYYFARAYGGPEKDRLSRKVRRLQAAAATDLDKALCLNARLRLGDKQDLGKAMKELLAGQKRDGSWPAAIFYADPVKNGKLYYNGGAALTTAFVLETLQLYAASEERARPAAVASRHTRVTPAAVLSLAKKQCARLPTDLRRAIVRSLTKLAESSNGSEIINLPEEFSRSLPQPARPPSKDFLTSLGLANLYGWLAYTIYDDFLDEEGQRDLLPAANTAMRRSLQGFLDSLPDDQPFRNLVREVFDAIDGANAWELSHCRFRRRDGKIRLGKLPDYGNLSKLAERSLGHTLAPLAILSAQGYAGDELAHTRRALSYYLIVRQLNDDLHDWQEDLGNGHITYVVARILSGMKARPGNHDAASLATKASKQFWYKTLPAICREMQYHIKAGREALDRAGIFESASIIGRLLDGIERSVEETLAQQAQAENFIKQYRKKAAKA